MIDEATGFSENHYLIDGKNYHAYELTYAIPEERCAASTSRPPRAHPRASPCSRQANVRIGHLVGLRAPVRGLA